MRKMKQAVIGGIGITLAAMLGVTGVATPAFAVDTEAVVPDAVLAACLRDVLRLQPADILTVEGISSILVLGCDTVA